jgi:hypothetical protein
MADPGGNLGGVQRASLEKLAGDPFDQIPRSVDLVACDNRQPVEMGFSRLVGAVDPHREARRAFMIAPAIS